MKTRVPESSLRVAPDEAQSGCVYHSTTSDTTSDTISSLR